MELDLIVKGLMLGIMVAMPVGPIGILCVHKTISQGRKYGFIASLGSVTADVLFSTVVALGIKIISETIKQNQNIINVITAVFLALIGAKIFFMNPSENKGEEEKVATTSLVLTYLKVLVLTLLNPVSILLFIALFAHLNISTDIHSNKDIFKLILSIFCGSAVTWYITTAIVALFSKNMTEKNIWLVEKIVGIVIMVISIMAVIKIFI